MGGIEAARAMAAHLNQQTLPTDQLSLAEYYFGGPERQRKAEVAIAAGMNSLPFVRADLDPALGQVLAISGDSILQTQQLAEILRGKAADGTALPTAQQDIREYRGEDGEVRHRVSYMDLTFSAPKKVSVAWYAAESQAERHTILEAHRTAVDKALRYIEKEVAIGHLGSGRSGGTEAASMAWITVDHFTSRPTAVIKRADPITGVVDTEIYDIPNDGLMKGDPQLHSHCLVPNILHTASGRMVAMNRDLFANRIHEFGGVYQMFLAAELGKAGIDVQIDRDPKKLTVDLPCIPDAVAKEFSKRTENATDAAREMAKSVGLDWDRLGPDQRVSLIKSKAAAMRKGKGDDLASWDAWNQQSERLIQQGKWWKHASAISYGPAAPPRSRDERFGHAYSVALDILEPELNKRAVITGADIRNACARAMIEGQADSIDDMRTLVRGLVERGVRQAGHMTKMLWREQGFQRVKVTTELHRDQEEEVVRLARTAAADTSKAIPAALVERKMAETGIDYTSEVGKQQAEVVRQVARGGAAQVFLGVAGAGKTEAILAPLVGAWEEQQRDVWGVANAWKIARDLKKSGIGRLRTRALQPFLDGIEKGKTKLTANSVVVVDELSQVGTRQLLHLLQLRDRIGFTLVKTGDDRQCQAVEAGEVVRLLRRAYGEKAIPKILDTIRQQSDREKEIAGLFRIGNQDAAATAIGMKRQDGNAILVPGTYNDCCSAIAAKWFERAQANAHDLRYTVTISAPSNGDALAISRECRALLQAAGKVNAKQIERDAIDRAGNAYSISLAVGDRVRLFKVTRGLFIDDDGRRRDAHVGDNGSILTIRGIGSGGLTFDTAAGKTAFVEWDRLRDKATGRLSLAYGYCLTIDTSQGMTSDEHILAMPGGSRHVQAFKAYVGGSRHRIQSFLIGSKGAEMMEVGERRPIGPREAVSDDQAWANVARNLSRAPLKELATDMLARAAEEVREVGRTLRNVCLRQEQREAVGQAQSALQERVEDAQISQAVAEAIPPLEALMKERAAQAARLEAALNDFKAAAQQERIEQIYRVTARAIANGTCGYADGVVSVQEAELDLHRTDTTDYPAHRMRGINLTIEQQEDLETRSESKLNDMIDAYMERGEQAFRAPKLSDAEVKATLEQVQAADAASVRKRGEALER